MDLVGQGTSAVGSKQAHAQATGGNLVGDLAGVGKIEPENTTGIKTAVTIGELNRQLGLADPAQPGRRRQRRNHGGCTVVQTLVELDQFPVAANKARIESVGHPRAWRQRAMFLQFVWVGRARWRGC